jgi:2-haloacid dehalogenase
MASTRPSAVIFDLGGVLIDWDPRYLYRKRFAGDEAAMEHFLANVCTLDWNVHQDAGRSFAEGCELLCSAHPAQRAHIEAWLTGFDDMMSGAITGTVEILAELHARDMPLYALSNWSAETFPYAQKRFEFLGWFRDIVISGALQLTKPDPRIYEHLLAKHGLTAEQTIFIDDSSRNVAAAAALSIHALQFSTPDALRRELIALGLLTH